MAPVQEAIGQGSGSHKKTVKVTASGETTPMQGKGDAADDPAIWIHPGDPAKSTIIGTNKKQGINVYSLAGDLLFEYPVGRINNVDVRYNFPLSGKTVDIVAGSNRSDTGILVMGINAENGSLFPILDKPIHSQLSEVYGFCLYHDLRTNRFFAFVNGTDGGVEQWELLATEKGKITGSRVRTFSLTTQTEGCVADDETGTLYIGQEDYGIWKTDASPEGNNRLYLVDSVKNGHLKKDIEGLTIYYAGNGKGYLIASSQGDNSYVLYQRDGKNEYVGKFSISNGKEVDGTSETDGIDVTGAGLGSLYPTGIFVAQDGNNKKKGKRENQNFKITDWQRIASGFNPPLPIDTSATKKIHGRR